MNNNSNVLLKVILDSGNIGKGDITKIQKILEKYTVNVTAELNKTQLINSVKEVLPQIVAEINKASQSGKKLDIDDSLIEKSINQVIQDGQRLQKELAATAQEVNKIQLLSNGGIKNDYATQIAKLEGNFRSLGFTQEEAEKKLKQVTSSYDALKAKINEPFNESNYQEIISMNDNLQKELVESGNEYARLSSSAKGCVSIQQRLSEANAIEAWNRENSTASGKVIANNEAYIASLRDLNTQMTEMQFNEITEGFQKSENPIHGFRKFVKNIKDQFAEIGKSFTQWLSLNSGISAVINQLQKMPQEVYAIDTAMTNLYKVTDETAQKYDSFLNSASKSAHDLGRSVSSLIDQTANWAKLG